MSDKSEWTPPRARPNNEPFTKGPPDPFKFDFQTAELLLSQLCQRFDLPVTVSSSSLDGFVTELRAKYNQAMLDAVARTREQATARMRRDIELQGELITACGEAAGLRDVGFKAPEVIVGAIRELAAVAGRYHNYVDGEEPLPIRARGVEARIDERTEPNGPVPPPVPAIAGGAVGGSDPTSSEKQGQGPQARPEYAEIKNACQRLYGLVEHLLSPANAPAVRTVMDTILAIERIAYELDREHE